MAEGTYLLPNIASNTEVQFVDGPLKDSNCPICLELLKDPFLTECCGHHFCNECVTTVQRQKNECPLCKTCPIRGIIDKRFKREINEALVYCSLRPQGCEWMGELDNLKVHLSLGQQCGQCKYVILSCPNDKCDKRLPRHQMKIHASKECDYRSYTCPHCGLKDAFLFIGQNHFPECPNYPVACPYNCMKTKIKRSQLQKHSKVCPNEIIPCCFSEVGCKVKLKRCNLKKHNETNFGQHQMLVSVAIAELQKESTAMKDKCRFNFQELSTQLDSKILTLEKKYCQLVRKDVEKETKLIEELSKAVPMYYKELKDELSATQEENQKLRNSLGFLQSKYSTLESEIMLLKSTFAATQKENKQLKNSLGSLQSSFYPLEIQVGELRTQLAIVQSKMEQIFQNRQQVDPSEMDQLSTSIYSVDSWINCYKQTADKMKRLDWKLYLRTMAETATRFPDPVSPVIIKFTAYKQGIIDEPGSSNILKTSSFYSAGQGKYKFTLVIRFNINSLSILACVTRGDYDDHLTWPFAGSITVTLLNHLENKGHYRKEIWSISDKPSLKCAGRVSPSHTHNLAFGKPYYISYEKLENSPQRYFMDDSLYFEVNAHAHMH